MSVIFRLDGLDAVLTPLISGSACATPATAPPASTASDDLRTLRRFTCILVASDIAARSSRDRSCAPILVHAAVKVHRAYPHCGLSSAASLFATVHRTRCAAS